MYGGCLLCPLYPLLDSMDDAKVKGTRKYEHEIWEKGSVFYLFFFSCLRFLNIEDPEQASSVHTNLVTKVLSSLFQAFR